MNYKNLPKNIPIFPLSGVLLLPGGQLPLNIFESRYLAMTDSVLANGRDLGMVQLKSQKSKSAEQSEQIYDVGCLGRVSAFAELGDGKYFITLTGLARFEIVKETFKGTEWRSVEADYLAFSSDEKKDVLKGFIRKPFIETLEAYFSMHKIKGSWDSIDDIDEATLIASVAMAVPFSPEEKQAILECKTLLDQGQMIQSLMEMAIHETRGDEAKVHH